MLKVNYKTEWRMDRMTKVYNTENETVTLVLNFNNDVVLEGKESIELEINDSFGSENFYIEGDLENTWQAKYDNEKNIYLSKRYIPEWND